MKLVVGITGATGAPVAIKLVEFLRDVGVEIHLVISPWARTTIGVESSIGVDALHALADHVHDHRNMAASISSGSFRHDGMVIVPCSMKTLAAIRIGLADNLITRSADVVLKERRKLVLAVREAPLNSIHLENMLYLSNLGAVIFPLTPAYYHRPQSVEEINEQLAVRLLDQFGLDHPASRRWRDGASVPGASAPG